MNNFKEKADLIWRVADLLRGDYKQSDYGKVILPMTVIRRLDCVLEPTKQKVLDHLPKVQTLNEVISEQSNETAGEHFTPREVIRLMVNILFIEDRDILTQDGIVRTLYDPACGTGGMLSVNLICLSKVRTQAILSLETLLL